MESEIQFHICFLFYMLKGVGLGMEVAGGKLVNYVLHCSNLTNYILIVTTIAPKSIAKHLS